MYLKLFILMGLNWILELATWLFNNKPYYVWFFADLFNSLQGVIIFIMFVCKKNVIRQLKQQFAWIGKSSCCHFRLRRGDRSASTTTQITTSTTQSGEVVQEMRETNSNAQPSVPATSSNRSGH